MKHLKQIQVHLLLFFISLVFSFSTFAQNAVLYNFDFQVPVDYRRELQLYDGGGNKKYKKDPYSNKMILDKSIESLSKKEVNKVCKMAADLFKREFGYTQVTIKYPLTSVSGFDGLEDFPSLGFKKAVKKQKADAYINMEIKIENKEPFVQWSDVLGSKFMEELGVEKIMFMNVTAMYTIYNVNEEIIGQKKLTLQDLTHELDKYFINYSKEVDEKGRYKLWKPYFTKNDIISIYKIVERKLEAIE